MGLISDFFRGFTSYRTGAPSVASKDLTSDISQGAGRSVFSLESGGFSQGGKELIKAYNTNPNIRKVVGIVSGSLAAVPFFLVRKKRGSGRKSLPLTVRTLEQRGLREKALGNDVEPIFDHPFLDFIRRGSPLMAGPAALRASYAYKELKGEFFWRLLGAEGRKPAMYVVVPPQNIASLPAEGKPHYKLSVGGKTEVVPEEEILWSKDANLSNLYGRGSGVGDSLADEIDSDEYAAALLRFTLANKGFKDTLISIRPEATANPTLAEQLEAKYNQRHRGFYNTGRAMVVDGAQVDVKQLTHDLGELRLLELRQWERDVISETWGIPPELLGRTQNGNRATTENAKRIYSETVQVPRLEAMRLDLQLKLLPLFDPSGQLLVEYVSPVPEDHDRRIEAMKAHPTAFTENEWRSLAGMPQTSWGDVRLVPMNQIETAIPTNKRGKSAAVGTVQKQDAVILLQEEIDAIVSKVDSQELVDKMSPGYQARFTGVAKEAFDAFPSAIGDFALINPLIETHMSQFGARWIDDIDPTTRALLAKDIAAGVEAGEGIAALSRRVRNQMGYIADGYRSTLIARTEVVRSSNFARQVGWEATQLPLRKRYISALISTTREAHAALHNVETSLNGVWSYSAGLEPGIAEDIVQPGNSAHAAHACHCILPGQHIDGEILAGVRSQYSGRIVTINTLKGHKLSVTPNHPILTDRGFVAAGSLRQGDNLISYSSDVRTSVATNSVNKNPSAIEQIFAALAESGECSRRGLTSNDLHGDAANVIGKVDIVSVKRKLTLQNHAANFQGLPHFGLKSSAGTATGLRPSAASGNVVGLSSGFPGLSQVPFDSSAILSSGVDPRGALRVGIGSSWHADFLKPTVNSNTGNADFFAKLENGSPGFVSRDQITHIDSGSYSGHVYDLQSRAGWIIAQGIAISNCLCTSVAFDPAHKALDVPRGSELHHRIAKQFEQDVEDWEAWVMSQMKPFYTQLARELLAELNRFA